MKTKNLYIGLLLSLGSFLLPACLGQAPATFSLPAVTANIEKQFELPERAQWEKLINQDPSGQMAAFYASWATINDELGWALWLTAKYAAQQPNDAVAYQNLGAMLWEWHQQEPDAHLSQMANLAFEAAKKLAPEIAETYHNHGVMTYEEGIQQEDEGQINRGIDMIRQAVTLAPNQAGHHSQLGQMLLEQGKDQEAAEALELARQMDPSDMTFVTTFPHIPATHDYFNLQRAPCDDINFHCMEVCPGGLIGRMRVVSCEIEQSSAQLDCMKGRPYPRYYDCEIEAPSFGIIIPGFYEGFGIRTPWGNFSIYKKSGEKLAFSLESSGLNIGPLEMGLTLKGTYNIKNHNYQLEWESNLALDFIKIPKDLQEAGLQGFPGVQAKYVTNHRKQTESVEGHVLLAKMTLFRSLPAKPSTSSN